LRTVENPVTKSPGGSILFCVLLHFLKTKFFRQFPWWEREGTYIITPPLFESLTACIYLVAELSEGDNVFSGVADLPLVELVLERLHDSGSVAHGMNQHNAKTPEDFLKKILESNETLLHYVNSQLSKRKVNIYFH
jgi:hypothetical protein